MRFDARADALRERLDVLTAELDQPGATPSQAAQERTAAIARGVMARIRATLRGK